MKQLVGRLLVLVILALQITACQSSEQEIQVCNQTINEKLELVQPYADWVQVLCTKEGHVIKSGKDYQWFSGGREGVYLNKTGEIQRAGNGKAYQDGIELNNSWGQLERVGYVVKNFNDFLQKLKPGAPEYTEAYSLGFRGDMPFTYNFFILARESEPEYMIVCKAQCHRGEPILIKVKRAGL